jgi:hypothetical protein
MGNLLVIHEIDFATVADNYAELASLLVATG